MPGKLKFVDERTPDGEAIAIAGGKPGSNVHVIGSGNKIVIAMPAASEVSPYELVHRASEVSRKLKLRYDVTEVAERNLRLPGDDGVAGKLLLDADIGAAVAR